MCVDETDLSECKFYVCDLYFIESVCSHPLEEYKYIPGDEKESRENMINNFLREVKNLKYEKPTQELFRKCL